MISITFIHFWISVTWISKSGSTKYEYQIYSYKLNEIFMFENWLLGAYYSNIYRISAEYQSRICTKDTFMKSELQNTNIQYICSEETRYLYSNIEYLGYYIWIIEYICVFWIGGQRGQRGSKVIKGGQQGSKGGGG
jgi:hypothetical protein